MTIMKKKCNKWTLVFLFYSLFIFNNLYKTAAAPEKLTPEEVLEELGVKIETKEWSYAVTGVEGNLIELPCNASTSKDGDDVKLVLWFKNGSDKPIYTYDNRDGSHSHWSDDTILRGRALFLAKHNPARLTIKNINYQDQSVYKCRVDFKMAPTSISSITLQVVVPPESPAVFLGKKTSKVEAELPATSEDSKHEMSLGNVNKNTRPSAKISSDWKHNYLMVNFRINGANVNQSILNKQVIEIGPFTLGDFLKLRCVSTRGRPSPNVTWWRDNAFLMDSSFQMVDGISGAADEKVVINDLEIRNLERHHNGAILTCRAVNNIMAPAAVASVKILMHYGPSVVKLMLRGKSLSAGKSHEIRCEAIGAKPQASISWWVGGKEINNFVSSALIGESNATISTLTYSPKPEDHGRLLACQAFVEGIPGSIVEDSRRLHILYAPRLELRLGRSLNASNIKEGDDVYFECLIHANPPPSNIKWTRDGQELMYSLAEGVIISNQSLVLQRVTKAESGHYQCEASNSEGKGNSNTVNLPIKYKPLCRPDQQDVYGVAPGETVKIPCDVIGDPSGNMRFEWVFNTSTEWYPKQPQSIFGVTSRDRGWTRAYIEHSPKSEMDFGSILCWARNDIGRQEEPCIFHLLPAGKPEPVTNCTVASSSYSTMRIMCAPGFNGGMKQTFTLEIRETDTPRLTSASGMAGNMSGKHRPDFMLTGLIPDTGYMISVYAVNAKGQSDRMVLQAYTQKSDQLFETNESALTNMDGFQLTPVFGVLMTVGCSMAIVFLSISAYFCVRKRSPRGSSGGGASNSSVPVLAGNSNQIHMQQHHSGPGSGKAFSVEYSTNNANVTIRDPMRDSSANQLLHQQDPDIVPSCSSTRNQNQNQNLTHSNNQNNPRSSETGGFEVEGDKTKFATLQRQRKQIYDEIRDSKCRVQQLRRNLLSPSSQFEGSAEKLLVNDIQNFENQNQHFYSSFGSSSGRASPCSTPTPPPYNRNRQNVPGQASISPQQWSPGPGTSPFAATGATSQRPPAPTANASSPMLMTRVVQRDPQQGKSAKFITYSCSPSDPDQTIAEENFDEAASVASSRESRV